MKRTGNPYEDARKTMAAKLAAIRSQYSPAAPATRSGHDVFVGYSAEDEPRYLSLQDRAAHHFIVGGSGSGKSRYLEHLIRTEIRKGFGACVIDPDGNHPESVYNNTLKWLKHEGYEKTRTIRLIDINDPEFITSLNPFFLPSDAGEHDRYIIAAILLSVFERVWQQDFITYPTIKKLLPAIFVALMDQRLSLIDVPLIFERAVDSDGFRAALIRRLDNRWARIRLQDLHDLTESDTGRANRAGLREYRSEVTGPINRITEFINTDRMQHTFAPHPHPLDLRQVMDEGQILLVNLAPNDMTTNEATARLIGTLLMREFTRLAMQRRDISRRFFLFVDEAANYLTPDVITMLDRSRKRGLSLVMALQRLEQLKSFSDDIYNAVLTNPNVYSVFRGLSLDEAGIMVDNMIELPVGSPNPHSIRMTAMGEYEIVTLESGSEGNTRNRAATSMESDTHVASATKAAARSSAEGHALSSVQNTAQMHAATPMPDGQTLMQIMTSAGGGEIFNNMTGFTDIEGTGEAFGRSRGSALTVGAADSKTAGWAQALKMKYAAMPTAYLSVEDLKRLAAWEMRTQRPRHFFFSKNRQSAERLAVPNVNVPPVTDNALATFKRELMRSDPAAITRSQAQKIVDARPDELEQKLVYELARPRSSKVIDVSDPEDVPASDFLLTEQEPQELHGSDNVVSFPGARVLDPDHPEREPEPDHGAKEQIEKNQTGITYTKLFGPCLRGARDVRLVDPYIKGNYTGHLLAELFDTILESKGHPEPVKFHLETKRDSEFGVQQDNHFEKLARHYQPALRFSWAYDDMADHARLLSIDDRWELLLDRGLDIYQRTEPRPQSERPTRGFYVCYRRL